MDDKSFTPTKKCSNCLKDKDTSMFHRDDKGLGGFKSQCKECLALKKKRKCVLCPNTVTGSDTCEACVSMLNEFNSQNMLGVKRQRDDNKKQCPKCKVFKDVSDFSKRNLKCNACIFKNTAISNPHFDLSNSSLNGFFMSYNYVNRENKNLLFSQLKTDTANFLKDVGENTPLKVNFESDLLIENKKGQTFTMTKTTNKDIVINEKDIEIVVSEALDFYDNVLTESHCDESGLKCLGMDSFKVNLNPHVIYVGSSYVDLPPRIKHIKACLNIKNKKDNKCFLWCIIAFFYRSEHENPCKPSHYNQPHLVNKFDCTGVEFPVALNNIPTFEANNQVTINVYKLTISEESMHAISLVYPLKVFEREIDKTRHINLLLYKNHYILITNINKLFSMCVNGKHRAFVCEMCGVSIFTTPEALAKHETTCKHKFKAQKYLLPDTRFPEVKFKNYHNMFESPFVIYADFESYFCKADNIKDTDKIKYHKQHKPMAYGYKIVCKNKPQLNTDVNVYIGENADDQFTENIIGEAIRLGEILSNETRIVMTDADIENFESSEICFICKSKFENNEKKARDHDHLTGKYRGAAHILCNLKYTKKSFNIPVVFHNMEGYDIHLFIESLARRGKDFDIIAKSKEKYITLVVHIENCRVKLKFIDSLHFFTGSLAENAKKLSDEDFQFIDEQHKELRFKQFFPYAYFTSLDKLEEKQLPSKLSDWYDDLRKETISPENLKHAQMIFNKFNCKNLKEYTILYLKTDINLLAEIFEKFRALAMDTYKLDPANYYTTPGFAWDAALLSTQIKLDLFVDNDMIDFFIEKGTMRGGISTVSRKKHAIANNKYLPNYNPSQPSSYIMYFDVTNLYGHTMTGNLPTGDFAWLDFETICFYEKNIEKLFEYIGSDVGHILEVDLVYPKNLKDVHIELPLAPEHFNGKLSPNLYSKHNYRTHVENLQYYLQNGLRIKKIHKILQFKQTKWLKPYIDGNTLRRSATKDETAKNYYKLMNNAVYGKTMENIFNRKFFKLIGKNNVDKAIKYTRDSNFKMEHILSEDMVLLEMNKTDVLFDKPIYVGFTILELSKLHMYRIHYDKIKKKYGDKATLMYMDTDSLIYEIMTDDVYKDMADDDEYRSLFDCSGYPADFVAYDSTNKGVLGTLKDEYASLYGKFNCITEFICLRSKLYSMKTLQSIGGKNEIKKCKGVMKSELNKIPHAKIVECNTNGNAIEVCQTTFKSVKHNIYTVDYIKDGISRFDNKRQLDLSKGMPPIYTVPWGYDKVNDFD